MDLRSEITGPHLLRYGISPSKMIIAKPTRNKYRTQKLKQICSAACALLNSGGGSVVLNYEDNNILRRHNDSCVRMIEQSVAEMVGVATMASHIDFQIEPTRIVLNIKEAGKFITLDHNLYFRTQSQAMAIQPMESPEDVMKIFERKYDVKELVLLESHQKRFVKGQQCCLTEDLHNEFKHLKETPSESVTLADRIVRKSNKLTSYVSAFANHRGGHIYYGISDQGEVQGEIINKKEKDKIVKQAAKTIRKMVWGQKRINPERGTEWEIFFEQVVDDNGDQLKDTFIVVIYVARFPGGVFTEEPESYLAVEDEVVRMTFREWWTKFSADLTRREQSLLLPSSVPRIAWSSEKNRFVFRLLNERLMQHRNDQDMNAFRRLSERAKEHFQNANVELIVLAEEVPVAYKNYEFNKAESLLKEYAKRLPSAQDSCIFEAIELQLKSMIERTKGNHEGSYDTVEKALQIMETIPIDLPSVWLCLEAAMTHAMQEQSARLRHLEFAAKCIIALADDSLKLRDLQQKLQIYKAMILLGYSITGDAFQQTRPSPEDMEAAADELASVKKIILKGSPFTHFRRIQYHLAECDLFRRRADVPEGDEPEDPTENLELAFKHGSKARVLANKHHFENMVDYARKRLADVTETLVRRAVYMRRRRDSRILLDLNY